MSEISMQGCFIDSKVQGRTLGDGVEFKVYLRGGPWVSLQGELVSEDYPMGFGLRFTGLTAGDERLLAQVIVAHGNPGGLPLSPKVVEERLRSRLEDRPRVLVGRHRCVGRLRSGLGVGWPAGA